MMLQKVFSRHRLLKYNSEKSTAKSDALENYISSANLSLAGCSSAEPDSVSVGGCKFQTKKLYLQTVKKVDHLPCTAATLRMYIDRKGWEVPKINVEVELENYPLTKNAIFIRKISYEGAVLDEDQLQRLHTIAEACPVHKIFHGNIEVNTSFFE